MKRKCAYFALLWYRVRDDVRIRIFCFYGSREFSKVASAWGGKAKKATLFAMHREAFTAFLQNSRAVCAFIRVYYSNES